MTEMPLASLELSLVCLRVDILHLLCRSGEHGQNFTPSIYTSKLTVQNTLKQIQYIKHL